MADSDVFRVLRNLTKADAVGVLILLAIWVILALGYWFMLPAIQSRTIPSAPGGASGPWVLRPVTTFHFGAVIVMATVTLLLFVRPVRMLLKLENAKPATTQFRPSRLLLVRSYFGLALYVFGMFAYLFPWTTVRPDRIEERLLWSTSSRSYEDIVSLEMIPEGERVESIKQDGPWYSITFRSGYSISLSDDNEGTTPGELRAMTTLIADRSGLTWVRRSDARPLSD